MFKQPQPATTTLPKFEIRAHDGVGPVKLGMTRSQVQSAFADYPNHGLNYHAPKELDYAFGNSIEIEFGDSGKVRFIGVNYYHGCGCDYLFQGRHIGDYAAEELFAMLAKLDGGENHSFDAMEYYFPNIKMTLWNADTQYDYLGGQTREVYGQVGVANQDYEDAVNRLEAHGP